MESARQLLLDGLPDRLDSFTQAVPAWTMVLATLAMALLLGRLLAKAFGSSTERVRAWLVSKLADWAAPEARRSPGWLLLVVGPIGAAGVLGLALEKGFDTIDDMIDGDTRTMEFVVGADPATAEGQHTIVAGLDQLRQENPELGAAIDTLLAAVTPKDPAVPLTEAERAAKARAATSLAVDPQP
jgi:hypothetical protein